MSYRMLDRDARPPGRPTLRLVASNADPRISSQASARLRAGGGRGGDGIVDLEAARVERAARRALAAYGSMWSAFFRGDWRGVVEASHMIPAQSLDAADAMLDGVRRARR